MASEIKAWPTPGYSYNVMPGDYLRLIAKRAYGDEMQWSRIWGANSFKSGNPDKIYPSDSPIFIPGTPQPGQSQADAASKKYQSEPKNSYKFLLDGIEVPLATLRLQRSIDTIYDTWVGETAWIRGQNKDLDQRIKPLAFPPAQLYLGSKLMATGMLYDPETKLGEASSAIMTCYTRTCDLCDSKQPPDFGLGELSGSTLRDIATIILGKLGYQVKFLASPGKAFDWVNFEKIESYADFIIRLAGQRKMLVTNDEYGAIVFLTPNANAAPVGTISESDIQGAIQAQSATGAVASQTWGIKLSGRDLFHTYSVVGQGGDATDIISSATDKNIPTGRTMTYEGEDDDQASVGNTAAWRRSKQLAKALSFPLPVTSWYNPAGDLWSPGQIVTIKSPTMWLSNGFNFLVQKTEHVFDESGMTATLTLCPPQCFTGDDLPEVWS